MPNIRQFAHENGEIHRFNLNLYVGGTSITKGGGFEPLSARQDIRPKYKEKYNIDLPKQEFISYASVIAKNIGVKNLINEAKSGSGTKRIIRKATEYIQKYEFLPNEHQRRTLYHFEFQPGVRDDIYFSKEKEYGICNASWNEHDERYQFSLVKEWFTEEDTNQRYDETYGKDYQKWIDNHFDEIEYHKQESRMIMHFISWLDSLPLSANYTFSLGHFDDCWWINEEGKQLNLTEHPRCINRYIDGRDPWNYAHDMQWLISDEIDSDDNHLGYWGNIKMGNKITSIIGELSSLGPHWGGYIADKPRDVIEYCTPTSVDTHPLALTDSIPHLKNIEFKLVPADNCKLMAIECDEFNQGTLFDSVASKFYEMQKIVKKNNGKLFLAIRQESFQHEVEESIFRVTKEWGWDKKDVIVFDCNITRANLDYLIKTYQNDPIDEPNSAVPLSSYFKNPWSLTQSWNRRHTFSLLVNKISPLRIATIDRFLTHKVHNDSLVTLRGVSKDYEDIQSLARFEWWDGKKYVQVPLKNIERIKSIREQSIEDYYPIENTEQNKELLELGATVFDSVITVYKNSKFNIVCETEISGHSGNPYLNHVSEKTLLPILCGCLVFSVVPGDNYKIMEDEWGLNFSYLNEFGISNYRNNTLLQNLEEVEKLSLFSQKGEHELEQLYRKHEKIIWDNYRVLENALYTNKTEDDIVRILNHHKSYPTKVYAKQKFEAKRLI